jgi:hypothetical protein
MIIISIKSIVTYFYDDKKGETFRVVRFDFSDCLAVKLTFQMAKQINFVVTQAQKSNYDAICKIFLLFKQSSF